MHWFFAVGLPISVFLIYLFLENSRNVRDQQLQHVQLLLSAKHFYSSAKPPRLLTVAQWKIGKCLLLCHRGNNYVTYISKPITEKIRTVDNKYGGRFYSQTRVEVQRQFSLGLQIGREPWSLFLMYQKPNHAPVEE